MKNNKKEEKNTNKPASIERIPPSIPAKLPKEVREISKYFKTTNLINNNKNKNKSYAQASNMNNNIREVLKIKETFLNLQAKKIENIQKIIRSDGKPKPKLNMITKKLSRKQIIIYWNNDNKINFIKDSSNHITNLNRTLKNIKSDIMVNFICQEILEITIVTNKVTSTLDLQTIENYMKNANCIVAKEVEVSYLPQSKSYLKIIGIPYLGEFTNISITSEVV